MRVGCGEVVVTLMMVEVMVIVVIVVEVSCPTWCGGVTHPFSTPASSSPLPHQQPPSPNHAPPNHRCVEEEKLHFLSGKTQ
ncbi:hypothetical protein E2C01_057995 [Portunus trituberculatus]|uniref:Uncharacterized protein n=1 Tax=Portunus trituberculatus TaxID=210409 RepID=A0A5B7H3G8_PORTR|nr:hypothetical protein [Portunus trituberculatus]